MGIAPPPASATGESVWCGDLNGLDVTSETPSGSIPATEWSFVVPIASSKESGEYMKHNYSDDDFNDFRKSALEEMENFDG